MADGATPGPGGGLIPRFEIVTDPTGRYLVWDNVGNVPATSGSRMLAFSTPSEAAAAIRLALDMRLCSDGAR